MKISILLPYKENFSPNYPGAVSLFVYETSKKSIFRKKSPPVLYGGSVDGDNVKIFREIKEIDGFLIGGASKSSKKFIDIIKNYYR